MQMHHENSSNTRGESSVTQPDPQKTQDEDQKKNQYRAEHDKPETADDPFSNGQHEIEKLDHLQSTLNVGVRQIRSVSTTDIF